MPHELGVAYLPKILHSVVMSDQREETVVGTHEVKIVTGFHYNCLPRSANSVVHNAEKDRTPWEVTRSSQKNMHRFVHVERRYLVGDIHDRCFRIQRVDDRFCHTNVVAFVTPVAEKSDHGVPLPISFSICSKVHPAINFS